VRISQSSCPLANNYFNNLHQLIKKGIYVGIVFMPLIPKLYSPYGFYIVLLCNRIQQSSVLLKQLLQGGWGQFEYGFIG